ncbi:MAG: hypothetical protein R3F50_04300 [Gammaproteobacteria bacterium]
MLLLLLALNDHAIAQQNENNTESRQTDPSNSSTVQQAADDYAERPVISIEQIAVTGQRSMFPLRSQIDDAKRALYSSYNDLNLDDEFDINCRVSDWTGTRIRELTCWPVFFENAVANSAQVFLRKNGLRDPVGQMRTQYGGKFDEMRNNIIKVARDNPEVEDALIELGTLEAAYEKKQAECRQNSSVLFIFRKCR